MVRRMFWVALGAGVGIMAVRQLSRTARTLTPSGMADRATGWYGSLADSARGLLDEIRAASAERELELYQALGLDAAPDTGEARATRGRPGSSI